MHGGVRCRNKQEDGRTNYNQPVVLGVMYNFIKHDISLIESYK